MQMIVQEKGVQAACQEKRCEKYFLKEVIPHTESSNFIIFNPISAGIVIRCSHITSWGWVSVSNNSHGEYD